MFRDISFGQYYPTNSLVHKLDARVKLLLTILFVVIIFFIKSYFGFMLTAFVLVVIILTARLPILSVLKSVRGILFIIIFTSLLNLFFIKQGEVLVSWSIGKTMFAITKTGVHTTIKMVLRLV
ncbi:MAG: energy-coupling factor transporter transmembrane protein EcfT, partial [Clostridia bacterium]|nr:energy-coupling factor transporter transmembrane protein EcfT [Clostridia bacterium]